MENIKKNINQAKEAKMLKKILLQEIRNYNTHLSKLVFEKLGTLSKETNKTYDYLNSQVLDIIEKIVSETNYYRDCIDELFKVIDCIDEIKKMHENDAVSEGLDEQN